MIRRIVDTLLDDTFERLTYLLYLPGDAAIDLLTRHAPALAKALGIGPQDTGGAISLALSVGTWLVLLILVGLTINWIRDVDRALTAYIGSRFAEARRQLRILRRRLTSWIGLLRQRHLSKSSGVAVAELELNKLESAVLRCYGGAGELRVVAADDVAARLKISVSQVKTVLRQLMDYRLVERAFGTDEGRDGHHITRAGQIYLIEH